MSKRSLWVLFILWLGAQSVTVCANNVKRIEDRFEVECRMPKSFFHIAMHQLNPSFSTFINPVKTQDKADMEPLPSKNLCSAREAKMWDMQPTLITGTRECHSTEQREGGFPRAGKLLALGMEKTSFMERVAFSRLFGSLGRIADREGENFR